MDNASDAALIREYTDFKSESAFAAIVSRHIGLVYSVALRLTGNSADAQDVAQMVFVVFAKTTRELRSRTTLTGWFYETTRLTSRQFIRAQKRRLIREQAAYMQSSAPESDTDTTWRRLEPFLEEGMSQLNERDRALVALRFFENKSGAEAATLLGISEWAAHKRTTRAVEKLRTYFTKQGIALTANGLVAAVSANAMQTAPVGFASAVSTAVFMGTAAGTGGATLLNTMALTKLKAGLIGVIAVASTATTLVIEYQSHIRLREVDKALRRQLASLEDLETENRRLLALVPKTNGQSVSRVDELRNLREESAALRAKAGGLTALNDEEKKLSAALARARSELRHGDTNQQITARSPEMDTRIHYTMALSRAMQEYALENKGVFPTNLSQVTGRITLDPKYQKGLSPDQYVIAFQGTMSEITQYAHPDRIILIRERSPWRNVDGKLVMTWFSLQGMADASCPADGSFDAWIQQHTVAPRVPAQ